MGSPHAGAGRVFGSRDPRRMEGQPRLAHPHNPILQQVRDAVEGLSGEDWFAEMVALYDSLDDHVGQLNHINHAEDVLWSLINAYMSGLLREE